MKADGAQALLESILREPPRVHRRETELTGPMTAEDRAHFASAFGSNTADGISYGIGPVVARYLLEQVRPDQRTLEIGSGVSTLAFALAGSDHTVITADAEEEKGLRNYAAGLGVSLDRIRFVIEPSEIALPNLDLTDLDLVLLDGKHAFPWPMLDWFYTADRLKQGGLMLLDDCDMRPVAVLVGFLKQEKARWKRIGRHDRTEVFEKLTPSALDVAWHMQPWTVQQDPRALFNRAVGALTRRLK